MIFVCVLNPSAAAGDATDSTIPEKPDLVPSAKSSGQGISGMLSQGCSSPDNPICRHYQLACVQLARVHGGADLTSPAASRINAI